MKKMLIATLTTAALGISAAPLAIAGGDTPKAGDVGTEKPYRDQSGAGSVDRDRSVGEFVDDATVTTKVKTALARDDVTKARNINVDTDKGVVVLSGQVDSQVEAERAASVARSIEGVIDVRNLLTAR